MKRYQAVRISINDYCTYGDRYQRIVSEKQLNDRDIIQIGDEKFLILFEEEED